MRSEIELKKSQRGLRKRKGLEPRESSTERSLAWRRNNKGAREAVWDAEGRACFGEAEELDARAQALQSIMAAEEQNQEDANATENTRTRQTAHKFNEKQVYKLMMGLPDNTGGPKTRPGDGCWKGAPAELWMLVARLCSGLLAELWPDVAQHGGTPQNYRDEKIVFLPKAGKNLRDARNGWRTIYLLDHLGKAYSRGLIRRVAV